MLAYQLMTRQVITVGPDTSVVEAIDTMLQHHISGLPVVDTAGKLVGIISDGDFVRRAEIGTQRKRSRWLQHLAGPSQTAAEFVHQRGRKVAEIMTLHPVTIAEDTQIEDIVRIIEQHSVKHLPVMRGDQLVGIVTRTNLLQAISALAPHVPDPTPDDQHIRSAILAAMDGTNWSPSSLNLIVRDGVVYLSGMVANEHCRQAAVVAAENVPGVRQVHDQLCSYPPPEEELGGGDIVSLQQQPSTIDDMPL
jgi:CBS domain-containing protein